MQRLYSRVRNMTAVACRSEGGFENATLSCYEDVQLLQVKARLGGVLENTKFAARVLRVCQLGIVLAVAQDAPTLRPTPDGVVYALSDALRFCAAIFPEQLFASEEGMHDAIFRFLLHFASDPKTVSNPYTRAHLVKAMYGFIPTGQVNEVTPNPKPLTVTPNPESPNPYT